MFMGAIRRRARLRREAGRLVVRHGLPAALAIGRVIVAPENRARFERLARRCERDLEGLDSSTRWQVAARWQGI